MLAPVSDLSGTLYRLADKFSLAFGYLGCVPKLSMLARTFCGIGIHV
jgi:hypothetical protein